MYSFVILFYVFCHLTSVTAREVLLLVTCVCDHALEFARWQHPTMSVGRGSLCLAPVVFIYTVWEK